MKKNLLSSLFLFGELGLSISIPLIALALFGRYLDNHLHTSPYFFLAGIVIATIFIFFYIKKIIYKFINKMK